MKCVPWMSILQYRKPIMTCIERLAPNSLRWRLFVGHKMTTVQNREYQRSCKEDFPTVQALVSAARMEVMNSWNAYYSINDIFLLFIGRAFQQESSFNRLVYPVWYQIIWVDKAFGKNFGKKFQLYILVCLKVFLIWVEKMISDRFSKKKTLIWGRKISLP